VNLRSDTGRNDTGRSDTGTAVPPTVPVAPPEPLAAVSVRDASKAFGTGSNAVLALDRLRLDVRSGEFVCLVGASGCGKTTLLNLVAGLDQPTAGSVTVGGRAALMFQEAALFPWLTVAGNVELALRLRPGPRLSRRDRRARAESLLRSVHLEGFADRRPHELSGGMRQRVALARAFAQDADVLLMDEPFGALDAMTRDLLHDELERLWADRSFTVLFVTHNVREAARLADRVVLLSSRPGRVVDEFVVDNDRPRRIDSPEVSGLAARVTDRLREEVRRHA
jgi:NitT/TauT family transport system ATP-binding protein